MLTAEKLVHASQLDSVETARGKTAEDLATHVHEETIPSPPQAACPTEDELRTLRRVPGDLNFKVFTIALIELCERFTYYGTGQLLTNFIQRPLPLGSTTGASGANAQSGALGFGQRAAYAINTFKQFFFYITPLFGAYLADVRWGRYKTICVSIGLGIIAHIVIVIAALPQVIFLPTASLSVFVVGLTLLGLSTGGVKSNLAPLIVEQLPVTGIQAHALATSERVIIDPTATVNRVYMLWYLFTNIGALVGILTMPYVEKYRGFWLAWLIPTLLYLLCPLVMIWGRTKYNRSLPDPYALGNAVRLLLFTQKGRWSINPLETWRRLRQGDMWESVMPSSIEPSDRPTWMTFDDRWVREIRRATKACGVFAWYPLFFLCFNQVNSNLVSQAATMQLHGLPNEFITVVDPISIIVVVPIFDRFLFPLLRNLGINVSPIRRITAAFFCGSIGMVWAAVLQYYIYKKSPCDYQANSCDEVSSINVGAQVGIYVIIAIGEVLGNTTILEYAYTKAPENMRSLVQALGLFASAIAAALGQALAPLSNDPLLTWDYAVTAILAAFGGCMFWFQMRQLDYQEDSLNGLSDDQAENKADEEFQQRR
ncbi:POT family-domain-containing protein [Penicillium angulare]|uniref:POT family-domain-containing protein n=1 Tax=Penicillium angulare TaxID=116970 RepID=UPI0025404E56|nr:POT family-domain-containing protein [Penicillium angulare]KAJ5266728.1 POT family-domain-containing protein [Penicillium angulare]